MSGSFSPYPRSGYSDDHSYYNTPSPTPSPRPASYMYGGSHPQRPATRAHFRTPSQPHPETSSRPPTASPRYTSDGHYATKTANVSSRRSSPVSSPSTPPSGGRHARRSSHSEVQGPRGYYVPGYDAYRFEMVSRSSRRNTEMPIYYSSRHSTDHYDSKQGGFAGYSYAREELEGSRTPRPGHSSSKRRSSVSTPQRPSTARPSSSGRSKPPTRAPPKSTVGRPATEADRLKHRIPPGYSMKNWDPSETPILLLGSVFDANSLGKWIYDWTVYTHSGGTPTADLAGELWVLLIKYSGYIRDAEAAYPQIRSARNKEIVAEFIASGERLSEKLRDLLKRCEDPMLRAASKRKDTGTLGKSSGVEFVETLFGENRELDRTHRLMRNLEVFIKRFAANCAEIAKYPTM